MLWNATAANYIFAFGEREANNVTVYKQSIDINLASTKRINHTVNNSKATVEINHQLVTMFACVCVWVYRKGIYVYVRCEIYTFCAYNLQYIYEIVEQTNIHLHIITMLAKLHLFAYWPTQIQFKYLFQRSASSTIRTAYIR